MPSDASSPNSDQSENTGDMGDIAGPQHHIVLSPHYDDMALSIGATMATLADAGREVTDLIVFGAEPSGVQLHAFARHHHDTWGLDTNQVITARKAEEAKAVRLLGASTANLEFFDAIYRSGHYQSDEQLFGSLPSDEADLPKQIAAAAEDVARSLTISTSAPAAQVRFYAPLGIGNHVDHQLAFLAGNVLAVMGYVVWLYEDLPYAMIGNNRDHRLASLDRLGLGVHLAAMSPTAPGWRRKIQAVLAYPTQLETVFRNYAGVEPTPTGIDDALATHHLSVGAGMSAERFWVFDDESLDWGQPERSPGSGRPGFATSQPFEQKGHFDV